MDDSLRHIKITAIRIQILRAMHFKALPGDFKTEHIGRRNQNRGAFSRRTRNNATAVHIGGISNNATPPWGSGKKRMGH